MTTKDGQLFNAPIAMLATVIKPVMGSAAEAEVGALFLNAQTAIPIRECPEELGHTQPSTIVKTDNQTAMGFARGTIKEKRSRTFDRQHWWLKDRSAQLQFNIIWERGERDLADHFTKHHPSTHHKRLRPICLHTDTSPTSVQGCIKILEESTESVRCLIGQYASGTPESYEDVTTPGLPVTNPSRNKYQLASRTNIPLSSTTSKVWSLARRSYI